MPLLRTSSAGGRIIQDVKIDFESKRVDPSEYDEIPKDPGKYVADKLKIPQTG